jgi:hypothetical protein
MAGRALGYSTYLLLFGWLGTAIHETGHALAALLFRQEVVSFRPFAPDAKRGTLGNVDVKLNYGSLYQYIGLFFVGIAPVLFGTLVIFLALYVLFQEQVYDVWRTIDRNSGTADSAVGNVLSSGMAFLGIVFNPRNLLDWHFYLFLYIAFTVGSSIALSGYDIAAAKLGCLPLVLLLFLFNTVLLSLGAASADTFAWLTQYYVFLYVLLCFVILLDLLAIALLWLPAAARRPRS